jgi:hypothetical protein
LRSFGFNLLLWQLLNGGVGDNPEAFVRQCFLGAAAWKQLHTCFLAEQEEEGEEAAGEEQQALWEKNNNNTCVQDSRAAAHPISCSGRELNQVCEYK